MVRQIRDAELIAKISEVIAHGEYDLHDYPGAGAGRIGALMEHLLGIATNNDPVPDAINWEIKTSTAGNLLSLFHLSPRIGSMNSLVRNFGWAPTRGQYAPGTLSFRCTISSEVQERGFSIAVSDDLLSLAFNDKCVAAHHHSWLEIVRRRCGGVLNDSPAWTFDEVDRSAGGKLRNLMLVNARVRLRRYVSFTGAELYRGLRLSVLRAGLRDGRVKVDVDARTQGKGLRDHGTKFRIAKRDLSDLYESESRVP